MLIYKYLINCYSPFVEASLTLWHQLKTIYLSTPCSRSRDTTLAENHNNIRKTALVEFYATYRDVSSIKIWWESNCIKAAIKIWSIMLSYAWIWFERLFNKIENFYFCNFFGKFINGTLRLFLNHFVVFSNGSFWNFFNKTECIWIKISLSFFLYYL